MAQTYLVEGQCYGADEQGLQEALAAAHASKARPRCLCQPGGVEMYVAAAFGRFVIKRLPDSGSQHSLTCGSFEPPEELSGLGEVARTAIIEDAEDGTTSLKLGFSLTKTEGRAAPVAGGREQDSVKSDGTKLGIRALLHYLWDQSGLTSWSPAMEGKRTWGVVQRALSQAAVAKMAKGHDLAHCLFVPETFSIERRDEIERRRAPHLARVYAPGKSRELMVLIGEVKKVDPARFGFKVVVKHLPDLPFFMDDRLGRRMERRFENELALWNADESTHLVMIATFGRGPAGLLAIDELAFMLTTTQWLPIDNADEQNLLAVLTQAGRRFRRGMRYNLHGDRPVAVAVTVDTQPSPVAMYVVPPEASPSYRVALEALIKGSALPAWVWVVGNAMQPPLPDLTDYQTLVPCLHGGADVHVQCMGDEHAS